jgi:hypothetical protein
LFVGEENTFGDAGSSTCFNIYSCIKKQEAGTQSTRAFIDYHL